MFEDYYFDDPALQDALAAAGYYTDPARTAAVMPSTVQAAEPIMGIGSPAAAAPAAAPVAGIGSPAAAAPMSYDALADRRAAANTQAPGTYLAAPTDNLGKSTGYDIAGQAPNSFEYRGGPVQVTDRKGNVLFSGDGPEGAVDAARFAQNLSDTKGKNASWDIQQGERTINPDGSVGPIRWVSGPTDSKEGMGTVGDLIAFVAPIAAAIATAGMSIPAQMAIAAAVGGISAVVAGNDPLKGAVVSGITAGLSSAGGKYAGLALEQGGTLGTNLTPALSKAIGTGIGATTGGLVTGSNLKNALLSGAASGTMSYYGPAIQRGIGAVGDAVGGAFDGINVVGGGTPGVNINTGGGRSNAPREVSGTESPVATVIGGTTSGVGIGGGSGITRVDVPPSTVANETPVEEEPPADTVIGGGTTGAVNVSPDVRAGIAEFEKNPIVSTANKVEQPTGAVNVSPAVQAGLDEFAKNPIVSTANKVEQPTGAVTGIGGSIPGIEDFLISTELQKEIDDEKARKDEEKSLLDKLKDAANIANAVSVLVPLAGGVLGGGGGGGKLPPDTSGLNFTANPLRPTTPGTGIGGIGGRYPYTPTTYGRAGGDQETEYMFFNRNPATGAVTAASAPATTRVAPAAISSGIGRQAPTATMTAAQPNSARYEEAVSRGSMTPQERALMRLVDSQQAAAVNPTELSQKLLDRAAQVEAINQRYKSQYGLQDSDIDAMFQGTYGLNMADSANSPNFEAARLISSPYRSELENIYGDLPTMRYALSSPVNALGRTRDSLSQLEAARNRAQQSLVDSSSPEWEQQYLAYMTGATEQMPLAPIGNTPEEWTRRMEIVRGYGPDIAYDTIKNWNDTRSADPARFAAERADYESVRNDATGTYNYALADLNRGAGIQSATTPVANETAAPVMVAPSGNTFAEGGEIDDDMVKHLVDYHKNGGHQGPGQVKGIGSGQEDKIPAYLSDGEYVWSAQDVSDLGDGSNREGVRRLDEMRKMVRQQAGRKDVKKIAKPQKGIDRMLKAVGGMA